MHPAVAYPKGSLLGVNDVQTRTDLPSAQQSPSDSRCSRRMLGHVTFSAWGREIVSVYPFVPAHHSQTEPRRRRQSSLWWMTRVAGAGVRAVLDGAGAATSTRGTADGALFWDCLRTRMNSFIILKDGEGELNQKKRTGVSTGCFSCIYESSNLAC